MSPEFMEALLEGRREDAEAIGGFRLPPGWGEGEDERRFLSMRLEQMRGDPTTQPWLVRAMVPRGRGRTMAGYNGFHGPPFAGFGGRPTAELGYTVFEEHRRRGYAAEGALGLMGWARREHGVTRFRVSVSPHNAPSLAMARKLGFEAVGSQMDEEDGLEIVYEVGKTAMPLR